MNQTETRLYRARRIEEILPKIREELGPDAIVVAQREGLAGGVGGFFQHPFVEVEARPGGAGGSLIDTYDSDDDAQPFDERPVSFEEPAPSTELAAFQPPPATAAELAFAAHLEAAASAEAEATEAAAAARELAPEPAAAPALEDVLAAFAAESAAPEPVPAPAPAPAPAAEARAGDRRADALIDRMVEAGLPRDLAADVVAETLSHTLPFGAPRQLKRLVRAALARRIEVSPGFRGRRRAVALVGAAGSGKTLVAGRLAAAYGAGSDLPVRLIGLRPRNGADLMAAMAPFGVEVHAAADPAAAAAQVWPAGGEGLAVVDTPAVSPNEPERVAELAEELGAMGLDEIHLALPATLSRPAAEHLLEALAPLGVTHVVLTHTDETPHVGPVVALAVERGLAFSFVSRGHELPGGLLPADATDLATRVIA